MKSDQTASARRWAVIPLRAVVGAGFVVHGWAKLSRGPAAFATLLHWMGVPFPGMTAWVATLLELAGGVAILLGAFVAVSGVPLLTMMLAAMFGVHWRYGFSSIRTIGMGADGPRFGPPGYEVNLLYIAALLVLVLGGAGPLSVDAWRRRQPRRGGSGSDRP